MRIMHILNHTRRLNGNVHAAVDLACAQSKMGYSTCVVSGGGDFDALLDKNGVETFFLEQQRRPVVLLKSMLALSRHLRRWKPDIVHAHMMTSAVLSFPLCKLGSIPLITTVHNEFEKSARLMGLGTRVIAVSEAVGASMLRRGVAEAKLRVVLNGTIGSARFEGRDRSPAPLSHPSILFVGGLHPRKGLPDLLEAFRLAHTEHPQAHLYVAGGGPFAQTYQQLAAETGCGDAIVFVGATDDPFPLMAGADIFVLPSHADPAPLVLSEAREAGCAIIATAVDGIPQLLDSGTAGILVPPRNPQALAKALCSLMDNPEELRSWRQRSQQGIEHLSISRVARETMEIYLSAIQVGSKAAMTT